MSAGPLEPTRLADEVSEEMRDALRIIREEAPGAPAIDRMTKRLAAAGALVAPSEASAPRIAPRLATYTRALAALAVVGGLALSWRVLEWPSTNVAAPSVAAASGDRVATDTAAEEPAPARRADEPPTPTLSVEQLPTATVPAAPVASTGSGAGVRTPKETMLTSSDVLSPPLASELELLQRAQAAVHTEPERALSITSEQARAYPAGEFIQEREVIAVEALARLGRKDEALRRARALVSRFPRTPYGDRLELAVGRPL